MSKIQEEVLDYTTKQLQALQQLSCFRASPEFYRLAESIEFTNSDITRIEGFEPQALPEQRGRTNSRSQSSQPIDLIFPIEWLHPRVAIRTAL